MEPLATEPEESKKQDLFERVLDKVNSDSVKAFLTNAKEEQPGDFGISGSAVELVDHLKSAVSLNCVTRDQVFSLLQEAEENGAQTILYYTPKTDAVRKLLDEPEEVGHRLFGEDWRKKMSFPFLPRLRGGWEIVDFRTPYAGKRKDWILKLYTFQESKVQVQHLEGDEVQFALKLKKNEYAVIFERRVIESVCIARWNSDPERPLLEMRVELADRVKLFVRDFSSRSGGIDATCSRIVS